MLKTQRREKVKRRGTPTFEEVTRESHITSHSSVCHDYLRTSCLQVVIDTSTCRREQRRMYPVSEWGTQGFRDGAFSGNDGYGRRYKVVLVV